MFKNIELSEINHQAVRGSLSVTFTVFFAGVFLLGYSYGGLSLGLYMFLLIFGYGLFIWGPAVIIVSQIERFFLRNRSGEFTVLMLFLMEFLLPTVAVLAFSDEHELPGVWTLSGVLFIGQVLRWIYLRLTGKLFNSFNKTHNYANQ